MSNQSQSTVVEFQIRPESNSMEEWLSEWNKRAVDARDGEPETLAYAAAINVEDENGVGGQKAGGTKKHKVNSRYRS